MPTLLHRSLMKMGKGGLVVTVPKGWADYYGLKPGDEVQMIANGDLTISPLKKQEDGKAETSRPAGG